MRGELAEVMVSTPAFALKMAVRTLSIARTWNAPGPVPRLVGAGAEFGPAKKNRCIPVLFFLLGGT